MQDIEMQNLMRKSNRKMEYVKYLYRTIGEKATVDELERVNKSKIVRYYGLIICGLTEEELDEAVKDEVNKEEST